MPRFSSHSLAQLEQCHPELQLLAHASIKYVDIKILEGYRNESRQNELYNIDKSQVRWPHSKHNLDPSMAFDWAPWPLDWRPQRFYYFAGRMIQIANDLYTVGDMTFRLRWGGDWDMDTRVLDQSFFDLGHFELVQ